MRILLAIATAFALTTSYANEIDPTYNYLEIGYATIPSDRASDFDLEGIGINFSYRFDNNVLMTLERQEVEDSFERPSNFSFEGFTLGYVYQINDRASAYGFAGRKRIEAVDYEDVFDRYYNSKYKTVGVGYSMRFLKDWEINAEARYDMIRYWDNDEEDKTGGSAKVSYYITEQFAISGVWEYQIEEDLYGIFLKLGF